MKKKLLLHSCCGPCSTSVIETLREEFDLSVFFYNPNIFPVEEYGKRLIAEKLFCDKQGIKLVEGIYDHEKWIELMKGFEDEPEGGKRCEICIKLRLLETAKKAKQQNYDLFAATITVSPHKSYELVSKLGNEIAKKIEIEFLDKDFKKKDGFKRSIELSKKYNLYRQDYCGCEFSLKDRK